MSGSTLTLVLLGVFLNTVAQFLLKAGANAYTQLKALGPGVVELVLAMAFNPYILGGLVLYVASFGLWIAVLARMQVSIAYPLLSIGYVFGVFAAYFIFNEPISLQKLLGVGLIMAGVTVLARI